MLRKIRVLVVEDSLVFRELLVQNLNKDEGIEVVAAARDPFEARDMILKYQPDVMTLDIEMPAYGWHRVLTETYAPVSYAGCYDKFAE